MFPTNGDVDASSSCVTPEWGKQPCCGLIMCLYFGHLAGSFAHSRLTVSYQANHFAAGEAQLVGAISTDFGSEVLSLLRGI